MNVDEDKSLALHGGESGQGVADRQCNLAATQLARVCRWVMVERAIKTVELLNQRQGAHSSAPLLPKHVPSYGENIRLGNLCSRTNTKFPCPQKNLLHDVFARVVIQPTAELGQETADGRPQDRVKLLKGFRLAPAGIPQHASVTFTLWLRLCHQIAQAAQ